MNRNIFSHNDYLKFLVVSVMMIDSCDAMPGHMFRKRVWDTYAMSFLGGFFNDLIINTISEITGSRVGGGVTSSKGPQAGT